MKKTQNYRQYLKKSFIQYAMVLFLTMAFLILGFFVYYYYRHVVLQNSQNNEEFSRLFEEEYETYTTFLDTITSDDDMRNVVLENVTSSRASVSRQLYDFSNHQTFKSYFVVVDTEGNTLISNLTKGNQLVFQDSLLLQRMKSRINTQTEKRLESICDIDFTGDQNCIYTFGKAILDTHGECIGYLFLNIRSQDVNDYVEALDEEVVVLDRFRNVIFSSFGLKKDPGDKLPERRFTLDVKENGIYDVGGTSMYVRQNHLKLDDIQIVTLTSIERLLQMFRMAGIFFLLMLVAVGILMILMTRLYTRMNERGVRDLMRDLEIKNLEEQFNPHFVFNVMESVRFQIDEDSSKAKEMLLAFSTLMRYSINHGQSKVRLETDIDYLNDYLMLQKIRYNNLLVYEFHIPDELLDCLIPKLLLQPIIENCIKHGFVTGKELHIDIEAKHEKDMLQFIIQDNGKGITQERLTSIKESFKEEVSDETVKHVGLYNVEKVLSMLYGDQYGLTLQSVLDQGTTVILTMPYEVEEEDV